MKLAITFLLVVQSARAGNTYALPAPKGAAEIEWLSHSSFRFLRTWSGPIPSKPDRVAETVAVTRTNKTGVIEFRSEHLIVKIVESTLAFEVRDGLEKLLLHETVGVQQKADRITLNRKILVKEEFFGLGSRTEKTLSAKGMMIESQDPFLISTAGYGLNYSSAGKFRFDLGKTNVSDARTEITGGNQVEYTFHYGPSVKDIFEERAKWLPPVDYGEEDVNVRSALRLPKFALKMKKQSDSCLAISALVHASLSGTRVAAINLEDYAEDENMQLLGQLIPMIYRKEWSVATGIRKQLTPFLITYLQEAKDKGYPMIHPLPMQFPDDPEGLKRSDEFMLGDEILVAPFCDPLDHRTVYLPRGNWTSFPGGQKFPGRQTIEIKAVKGEVPLFVKNGAVLPLASLADQGPMEMHYYPKLGGEFFIWEPDADFISQLHASPALDYYRVESETKKDRVYEWVLHHMDAPTKVQMVDGPEFKKVDSFDAQGLNQWLFDSIKKEVRLRVYATVGNHEIVNIWLVNR